LGVLLVAPLLLTWASPSAARPKFPSTSVSKSSRRWLEALGLLLALLFASAPVFIEGSPAWARSFETPYDLFPLATWAGIRFGQRGAPLANLYMCAVGIAATALGSGPFVRPTLHESLVGLQWFLFTFSTTTLCVAAVVAERTGAYRQAREAEA